MNREKSEVVFDLLEQSNTNWSIEKQPLITVGGIDTESYGLIRSDKQEWLATVGNKYTPYQNWQLCETIVDAAWELFQTDDVKFRGNSLKGGSYVYYQIELPDYQVGSDTLKRNLTALNSHNGTRSIGFGSSNTVVVCTNTFYQAFKDMSKFQHSASADDRIKRAVKEMRVALGFEKELMTSFEKMTELPVEKAIFAAVMDKLFDEKDIMKKSVKDLSGVKRNQVQRFNESVELEMSRHGGTLWGLFNSVTHYLNHRTTAGKTNSEEFMTVGSGERKSNMTFNQIMNWMENKESVSVLV